MELVGGGKTPIRVSIVDFLAGQLVYDEWLVPPRPVSNWLTAVSGASEAIVAREARHCVADTIGWIRANVGKHTILVAHGYRNDLGGLHLKPHRLVLDTARLFDNPALADNESGLAALGVHHLGYTMDRMLGHNSVEDAWMCGYLIQKVIDQGEG